MKWSVVQKTEWASVLSMCPTALLALYLYLPRTVFIITIGNYSPNPGNTMRRALLRGSPARSLGTLKPAWAPWGPQQIPAKQEIKIFSDPTKPWFPGPCCPSLCNPAFNCMPQFPIWISAPLQFHSLQFTLDLLPPSTCLSCLLSSPEEQRWPEIKVMDIPSEAKTQNKKWPQNPDFLDYNDISESCLGHRTVTW